MIKKIRFLPRLNLCYLQKKAYENHLKKMNNIKHPSKIGRSQSQSIQSQEKQSHTVTRNRISVIKQKNIQIIAKLSPYSKKVLEQTERENTRLFQAIQKCPSTISRKNLSRQSFQNQEFKQRISKFTILPGSRKFLLKCQISLDKINKRERQDRMCNSSSNPRSMSPYKARNYVKTFKPENPNSFNTIDSNYRLGVSQNENTENLLLERNRSKVKNHFQRSQITLKTKQKLQGFRENLQNGKKMHLNPIYKWKTRCFTTQMESHYKEDG